MPDEALTRRTDEAVIAGEGTGSQAVDERGAVGPIDPYQFWAWMAPFLGNLLLAAAGVLGLFTAAGAGDGDTYYAGFVTFGLAVIIIALRIKHAYDLEDGGRRDGLLLSATVSCGAMLVPYVLILGALGIGGIFAAIYMPGIFHAAGYAFFGVCAFLVYDNIKTCFGRPAHDRRLDGA